eukprot:11193147-Alexandrium_andersonii.AAC.1
MARKRYPAGRHHQPKTERRAQAPFGTRKRESCTKPFSRQSPKCTPNYPQSRVARFRAQDMHAIEAAPLHGSAKDRHMHH